MNSTPYIYILVFISFYLNGYSQHKKQLLIKGSDSLSNSIVQQIAYKKYFLNDSLVKNELELFGNKLIKKGFVDYQTVISHDNDSLYSLSISLNNEIKIITLSNPQTSMLPKDKGFKQLDSVNFTLPYNKLSIYIEKLTTDYKNKGYPFVKIYLKNIQKDSSNIKADLVIKKGNYRTLDKIVLKGYENFPTSFIKHYLKLNKNTTITEAKMSKISSDCYQLPFVSEIKKPEILFTKDSTALYLYLNKSKSNSFDGLIGVSNSQNNKHILINGYLNLQIQNALNFGESLNLNWISEGHQSQSLKLQIRTPYILKSPLSSTYKFAIYKKDTTYLSISNNLSVEYQIQNKQKLGFILSNQESNTIKNNPTENFSDYSNLFYGFTYSYEIPNMHPIFNTKFFLRTQVSKGVRNKAPQNKISTDLKILFKIAANKNILVNNTSEVLFSKSYLDNELFRLGGVSSIRGFTENSLLAKSYTYFNIEYTYLTNHNSYMSLLSDFGILKGVSSLSTLNIFSVGLGYTTTTPIGRLGISYFVGNTNQNPFSFKNSKLHFRLLQKF